MVDKSPFHMPTDEEVFALRDEEQQRKRQERERNAQLHVWEKGVTRRALVHDEPSEGEHQTKLNLVAAATRDRRKEKENMADFIAKKREMFLVQMSLDTKRAEIRKLEERAQQREEVPQCHASRLYWLRGASSPPPPRLRTTSIPSGLASVPARSCCPPPFRPATSAGLAQCRR